MPTTLSIGFSKKIGLPEYGSAGAHCQVEFEIDRSVLQEDLDAFHQVARKAFIACQQAVQDQLARQQPTSAAANAGNHPVGTNGHGEASNGRSNGSVRRATASQARALTTIATRHGVDLVRLLTDRYHVDRPEDLSISDASRLIDELKGSTNGIGGRR
jgi:hypothetical protein